MNTALRNVTPEEQLAENAGDPVRARWSTEESLMATLIDELRQLSWMYASAHTEGSVPKPTPIKRPGVTTNRRKLKVISLERARRMDPRLRDIPDDEAQEFMDRVTGRG